MAAAIAAATAAEAAAAVVGRKRVGRKLELNLSKEFEFSEIEYGGAKGFNSNTLRALKY